MDKLLAVLCIILAVGMSTFAFPEGAIAVLIVSLGALACISLIRRFTDDNKFLSQIFIAALLLRMLLGAAIYFFDLFDFFGPDARSYDIWGQRLLDVWLGRIDANTPFAQEVVRMRGPGWGMHYLTAFIYLITGRSMLIVQSFCALFGAATAPMVYFCAKSIYSNQRVARFSAVAIALFPSFIIWSAQMLKDGLIIFLLVLTITMVLQLQKRFSYVALALLIASLCSIISLRFYIFYMVAAAVAGSFVIGISSSPQSLIRRTIAVCVIGLGLAYLGVLQNASTEFEKYGAFERLQITRQASFQQTGSGFVTEDDADVSTAEGAVSVLPIGVLYLMFAPFPWQVSNFRQVVTLPEVFLWWAILPFAISGLWYTLKNRLRPAVPVLIFTLLLTVVYSLSQGNVGTAYRQRAQIQVFLFIFIAVGWALFWEKKENKNLIRLAKQKRFAKRLETQS